jgi:CubicO group peptidase (beta-lactamase class C family)
MLTIACLTSACNRLKNGNTANNIASPINYADSLDIDLQNRYDKNYLPGFAIAIFSKDSILYEKGFGYSNLETKQPFTQNTIQLIASVAKTFIGVSLMKAVENGKLNLDDEINNYLPFSVVNPNFPNSKITIRHLAMHTSSISDSKNYNRTYLFEEPLNEDEFSDEWQELIGVYNQNKLMPVGVFLEKILSKNGEWYDRDNFYNNPPGKTYEYSNIGATLLAFIIARVTNENFQSYTRTHIFDPLNMSDTSWEKPQKDNKNHTIYYRENFKPFPNYSMITYPDGGLYSTVADLTKYLQEIMKGYNGEGTILSKEAFLTMMKKPTKEEDYPDAICWDLSIPCCIGHAGNDFGTSTLMYFEPATGIGRILFANVSIENEKQEEAFYGIFNDLFKYDLRKK